MDALQQTRTRLAGPAVLLPIPANEKGPRFPEWQKTTLAAMDDPDYLARFRPGGNIGVLLGEPSQGLCTVDLDGQAEAETFLTYNPDLRATLQTSRVRGENLWLRIWGVFPKAGKIKDRESGRDIGEWRANGNQTVIQGAAMDASKGETEPTAYRILHDAPPLEIPFEHICWPDGWLLPWTQCTQEDALAADGQLIEEHGEPFTRATNGKLTLNSMYFVARFARGGDVLYEPGEGSFYVYHADMGLWRPHTSAALKVDLATDLKEYAGALPPADASQIVNARTERALAGFVGLLQGQVEEREAFRREHGVIHCANGMLHVASDPVLLRPFAASYRSRNATPVAYDPAADCPRFQRELLESALEPDDVSLIQRYAGACLLGRNVAQKILVLTGTAGGGKSTLVEIIERMLGTENVGQLRTEHLSERFEIARFVGKTLLCGKDVPGRFLEEKGAHTLKALVGHDLLDGERKGSNASFPIRGDFSVIITCNSRLKVRLDGDADAWRRRLLIPKYERLKPARPERDFASRLLADEGPGILRWMVDGARAHLAELADCGEYVLTARQEQRVNALLAESDSVREFVRQCVETHDGSDVAVFELVKAYMVFCDSMGWEPVSARGVENVLADAMQELRWAVRRNDIERGGKSKKGFSGVRLVKAVEAATV